jgi:TonB family protein
LHATRTRNFRMNRHYLHLLCVRYGCFTREEAVLQGPSPPFEKRVDNLISQMTLEELIGEDAMVHSNRMVVVMNTAVKSNDWIGRTIDGRFPLLECLADTGVEAVFRTDLGGTSPKRAVIRLIRADAGDATSRAEAWVAASKLSHPHLMRILHTGRCEIDAVPILFAVTEFAEESLSEIIPVRPLTPDEAREMLLPILDALAYLHRNGMVHGRLKPSNILVVDNRLKLPVDNLAGATAKAKPLAELQVYDAPEAATGRLSPASDIWSLGITVVEALTQHVPRWDRSKTGEPAVPASVPQPFADIARECLRLDAQKRLTLHALGAALDPSRPVPVPPPQLEKARVIPISKPVAAAPQRALPKARVALVIGALAVAAAIIGFVVAPSRRSQAPSSSTATQPPAATAPAPQPEMPPAPAATGSTAKGEVAERVSPDVSESALRTIHGKVDVVVRVAVDRDGTVSGASFDSHGSSKYFADHALSAARNWKFKPPQVNGAAVSSVWVLRFQFRRDGAEIKATEVTPKPR